MEFRALNSDELEVWLDHVSNVFSAGRQYFSNHWHNDPWKDFNGIRVAVDDGQIVSSLRVFIRKMYFHGEPVSVGGIGEVSTRMKYRKQGLATQLLKDSIQFMEDSGIAISMLHGYQRIYAAEGWEPVKRHFAKKTLKGNEQNEWNIRQTNFQDTDEVKQLAALYETYSQKYNGTFVRDDIAYWTDWVKTESQNIWVAERDGVIEGYVSVRERNEELMVMEFAQSEKSYIENGAKYLFDIMLSDIIAQMERDNLVVGYPAPIADGFSEESVTSHRATMYRVINSESLPTEFAKKRLNVFPDLMHYQVESIRQTIPSHHVFWHTDGF